MDIGNLEVVMMNDVPTISVYLDACEQSVADTASIAIAKVALTKFRERDFNCVFCAAIPNGIGGFMPLDDLAKKFPIPAGKFRIFYYPCCNDCLDRIVSDPEHDISEAIDKKIIAHFEKAN